MVNQVNMANMTMSPALVQPAGDNAASDCVATPTIQEESKPATSAESALPSTAFDSDSTTMPTQKPVAGIRWTLEEERILCRAIEAGKTPSDVSKLLDRSRSAITGKIYGLVSEGWQPKALRKRRSLADLYDDDTKENFKIPDTPARKTRGQNSASKRRRSGPAASGTTSSSLTTPDIYRVCELCSQNKDEEMFECLQCTSRYHATCLDGTTDNEVLSGGPWICIKCLPTSPGSDQLTVSAHSLIQLENQLITALSDLRKVKDTSTVNTLKHDLSMTRGELQESHKRLRSMEKELNEAKATVAGNHENMHLQAQFQGNGIRTQAGET